MKKYIMIAGLLLGLACFAQTATTPGTPSPHDPNYQGNTVPNASTQQYPPDQQSPDDRSGDHNRDQDRDRTSSDQQQYPDTPSTPDARDNRHDRDSQTRDQDHHDQPGDMDRDRNSERDRQPQSDQTSRQDDHDHHDMGDRNDPHTAMLIMTVIVTAREADMVRAAIGNRFGRHCSRQICRTCRLAMRDRAFNLRERYQRDATAVMH